MPDDAPNPTEADSPQEILPDELGGPIRDLLGKKLGDFRILSVVGQGSMGVVFEATQDKLKRRVALKVLPPTLTQSSKVIRRFLREAESVAKLSHENIVEIYDIGEQDGLYYYAMRFVKGFPLDALIRHGPVDYDRAAIYIKQAAEAVEFAHVHNIIHRDIKPSNLIHDSTTEKVMITDFGLARPEKSSNLTESGALVGTPVYMSPEQVRATKDGLDRRTDIYSLGATLYELLAGSPPFHGKSTQEILQDILEREPRSLRRVRKGIPWELEVITLRAMDKDPERRFQSARELANDLDRYLRGESILARPSSMLSRVIKRVRKHHRTALTIAIISVIALASILGSLFSAKRSHLSETLIQAESHRQSGNHEAALQHYRRITGKLREDPRVSGGMGLSLYQMAEESKEEDPDSAREMYLRALSHLDQAIAYGSLDGNVRVARGRILLLGIGETDQTLEGLRDIFRAAEEDQDNYEVHLKVADIAFTASQREANAPEERRELLDFARHTANRAVLLNPKADDARVTRAKIFLGIAHAEHEDGTGDNERSAYLEYAYEDIQQAIKSNPNNFAAHGLKEQIVERYMEPDWMTELIKQGIPLLEEITTFDEPLIDPNLFQNALDQVFPTLWGSPPPGIPSQERVDHLLRDAKRLELEGEWDRALTNYLDILDLQQDYSEVHWRTAEAIRNKHRGATIPRKELEIARNHALKACDIEPTHLDYLFTLFNLANELEDQETLTLVTERFRVLFPHSDPKALIERLGPDSDH